MRLGVVMPVYNESLLVPQQLERLRRTAPPVTPAGELMDRRVYLIDDGSSDGTRTWVKTLQEGDDLRVILHDRNLGKGAAVRSGLTRAIEDRCDVILIQDADLEYDPRDHAKLVMPILDGRADAVIGSRFLGETHRVLYYGHYLANRFITTLSNVLTNLNLSDIECCLKAFSLPAARGMTLREDRFGIEPEIIAQLGKLRLPRPGRPLPAAARVYEVGVSYAGRTYDEGKKIRPIDGVHALWCIVRYNLLR